MYSTKEDQKTQNVQKNQNIQEEVVKAAQEEAVDVKKLNLWRAEWQTEKFWVFHLNLL